MPVLMCMSGRPGVGKTTIARQVTKRTGALWLWLDEIEAAMRASHMQTDDLADGGYAAAQAVAKRALMQGYDVLADCTNPIALTRDGWRDVSRQAGARHLDVELYCSDPAEHRRRVVSRKVDPPGWVGPDWDAVQARDYEDFDDAEIRIDTAITTAQQASDWLCAALRTEARET